MNEVKCPAHGMAGCSLCSVGASICNSFNECRTSGYHAKDCPQRQKAWNERTCCTSHTSEPHGPQCVTNVKPYVPPSPADHVIHGVCENEAWNHDPHYWGDGNRFHCSGDVGNPVEQRTCCDTLIDHSHATACAGSRKPERVNHPAYYGGADNPYEVIKVCEAWGLDRDAYLFNVVKYVGRPGKGDYLRDLKAARFYLDRRIKQMERDQ